MFTFLTVQFYVRGPSDPDCQSEDECLQQLRVAGSCSMRPLAASGADQNGPAELDKAFFPANGFAGVDVV